MLLIYKIKRILKQLWKKLVMNLQIPRKTEAPRSTSNTKYGKAYMRFSYQDFLRR